jgi:predicted kinase
MRVHYPRTPHLPWSPGATADDVRTTDLSGLLGHEVVVTEKLDGENTTLYRDGLHARSLDSAHHPSRAWVKSLHGRIASAIPAGRRVCGENLYARHSLSYQDLDSWFYGFSVWDGGHCLAWDPTVRFLRRLGVPAPRVLWRGVFDERVLRALPVDLSRQEGYVVRVAAGFDRAEFPRKLAKWVRSGHVQTDVHWAQAPVVENGLGPGSALWAVRSGAPAAPEALLAALGVRTSELDEAKLAPDMNAALSHAYAGLDAIGRTGDARLAGVLAVLLHGGAGRAELTSRLAEPLGMPTARRVADLAGLADYLHSPYPDEHRRAGLTRMSFAADLGVLHVVADAVLAARTDPEAADARAEIEWSALHAEDAGLLGQDPLRQLRTGLRAALADLDADAADRCWAEARQAHAAKPLTSAEEAVSVTWRWRSGAFPRLIHLIGPSGSGKSTLAARLTGAGTLIALDELRESRGSRADQRGNGQVLTEALDRLDAALAAGGTVVWDATSLNPRTRALARETARRRDAWVTNAVLFTGAAELRRRNAAREHAVPPEVLEAQLRRFVPPYPGNAHRTWYLDASGTVCDTDGTLHGAWDAADAMDAADVMDTADATAGSEAEA